MLSKKVVKQVMRQTSSSLLLLAVLLLSGLGEVSGTWVRSFKTVDVQSLVKNSDRQLSSGRSVSGMKINT